MTTEPQTAAPLTTLLGAPTTPHRPSGVEAERYYCSDCGHEVQHDDDAWWHEDERYNPDD